MKLCSHSISLVLRRASPSSNVAVQLPRDKVCPARRLLSAILVRRTFRPVSFRRRRSVGIRVGRTGAVRPSHGEEFFSPARHVTFPESFLYLAYTHAIAHSQFRLAPTSVASVYPLPHSLLVRCIDTCRSHSDGAMIRFVVRPHEPGQCFDVP